METLTTAYTRGIRIDGLTVTELQPGDQVDVDLNDWRTVLAVGDHAEDVAECDGDCLAVVRYADDTDNIAVWHVADGDEVYARFAAVAR